MTRPDLYEAMAAAERRNPDGEWWKEFDLHKGMIDWRKPNSPRELADWVSKAAEHVRLSPRTYTLHVEDMPEPMRGAPKIGTEYWLLTPVCPQKNKWTGGYHDECYLAAGLCYLDENRAREASEKLTAAMGVKDE